MNDPSPPHLSKSRVLAGKQCARRLWLECFAPELAAPPDPALAAILDAGTEVGRRAHLLFPGGGLVDARDFAAAHAHTAALVADPKVPAIFEAAFEHDRVRIRVDVLERLGDGTWGLREVKSASGVKDTYLDDVAVQHYVLAGAGLRVPSVEVIHVNSAYVRGAGAIDWPAFFTRVDVGALVRERRRDVPALVAALHHTLAAPTRPVIEPSAHCWSPYGCQFWSHCTREKPEDWIYHLPRLRAARLEALRAAGVERITDIPRELALGAVAARIRDVLQSGEEFVSPGLGTALAPFGPPAYYLDFETMNPAIPLYPGTRPYERIPFQWSLHRVDADGRVSHREFLADGRADPRRALAEALLAAASATGQSPGAGDPIVSYSGFEAGVLGDLCAAFPDLAPGLTALRARLADLLPVVQAHVYHPDFRCSFSLKNVAPALVAGFGYDDLAQSAGISDGAAASGAFHRLAAGRAAAHEEAAIRAALRAYCQRDTLALVEVHRALCRRAGA